MNTKNVLLDAHAAPTATYGSRTYSRLEMADLLAAFGRDGIRARWRIEDGEHVWRITRRTYAATGRYLGIDARGPWRALVAAVEDMHHDREATV